MIDVRKYLHAARVAARSLYRARVQRRGRLAGSLAGADFAVATKNGLYALTGDRLTKCLDGIFYGVTLHQGALLCFEALPYAGSGRILRLGQDGHWHSVVAGLSPGCHQIDVRDGALYVANTYANEVLSFDLGDFRLLGRYLPRGPLAQQRRSANYAHLNSLFLTADQALLLCHNETAKTGRPSEVLVCDRQFRVQRTLPLDAASAHNVVPWKGELLVCDSGRNRLMHGPRTLAELGDFTRGLAVTDRVIAVGLSAYGRRQERGRLGGEIVLLDHQGKTLSRLAVPGMVQEIRALSTRDWGLSEFGEPGLADRMAAQ